MVNMVSMVDMWLIWLIYGWYMVNMVNMVDMWLIYALWVSIVMGVPNNGWFTSWKIPLKVEKGWWLGVPLFQETPVWLFTIQSKLTTHGMQPGGQCIFSTFLFHQCIYPVYLHSFTICHKHIIVVTIHCS